MKRPTTIDEGKERLRVLEFRLSTLRAGSPYRIDAASHVREAEKWLAELEAEEVAEMVSRETSGVGDDVRRALGWHERILRPLAEGEG